ncbi:MAG: hypothetical protein A4E52_00995 [Pelotomaculum sp. PtaB.Bin013]|nr:MAG: hypothetical protein A4E52_00995 [Pelotomaculum sp. PtaB.Bin013]
MVNYLVEDIEQMARETNVQNLLADAYNKSIRLPTVKIDEEVKRLENKIIEKKRQQRMVYFDRIKGNVNEALYIEVAAEIEKEITVLNAGILRLKEELIKTRQVEESIQKTNSGQIQININDIDRMFLEKFIKKIIIIDNGEEISESIKEKYNLDLIFTGEQLGKISHRKIRLIILYK